LVSAAQQGRADIIELLLKASSNVNLKTKTGKTALMGCAEGHHKDVVQILIEAGAIVDLKDEKERTAYDYAMSGKSQKR
jgi:uncharacterized protein